MVRRTIQKLHYLVSFAHHQYNILPSFVSVPHLGIEVCCAAGCVKYREGWLIRVQTRSVAYWRRWAGIIIIVTCASTNFCEGVATCMACEWRLYRDGRTTWWLVLRGARRRRTLERRFYGEGGVGECNTVFYFAERFTVTGAGAATARIISSFKYRARPRLTFPRRRLNKFKTPVADDHTWTVNGAAGRDFDNILYVYRRYYCAHEHLARR